MRRIGDGLVLLALILLFDLVFVRGFFSIQSRALSMWRSVWEAVLLETPLRQGHPRAGSRLSEVMKSEARPAAVIEPYPCDLGGTRCCSR